MGIYSASMPGCVEDVLQRSDCLAHSGCGCNIPPPSVVAVFRDGLKASFLIRLKFKTQHPNLDNPAFTKSCSTYICLQSLITFCKDLEGTVVLQILDHLLQITYTSPQSWLFCKACSCVFVLSMHFSSHFRKLLVSIHVHMGKFPSNLLKCNTSQWRSSLH